METKLEKAKELKENLETIYSLQAYHNLGDSDGIKEIEKEAKELLEKKEGCGKTFKNERAKLGGYKIFCGTGTAKDNLCPKCKEADEILRGILK